MRYPLTQERFDMPQNQGFMAMKITEENLDKISIINDGVVLSSECLETPCYFVFPYDFDLSTLIVEETNFHRHFKFMNTESKTHFVDCIMR